MSDAPYDLAVVGAGPAGSTAAALARQEGWRVLVVEKERFPRFRIGESLLPACNAILQRSGVWPSVEAAGFFPKYGAAFYSADGGAAKAVDFRHSLVPGLEHTFQVERARFDAILLDHAAALGAEVRMATRVEAVAPEGAGHRLRLSGPAGAEETATARWVFDAGGRLNGMQTSERRELDPPRLARRVAVFSHFAGVERAEGRAAGDTVVVRIPDGWFWLIPLDEVRTSVGLVIGAETLRREGGNAADAFRRAVDRAPKMRELMARAGEAMPFAAVSDYSYFHRRLARGRFVRIGDAAGFFDPIFSSGVYMGLSSAALAVDLVRDADRRGRGLSAAEAASYTRRVKRRARTFERLIHAFYDDAGFEIFMSPEIPFDIRPGMTAVVAGQAELPWPVWWRYRLFLAAWAVHRRIRVAPPLARAAPKAG